MTKVATIGATVEAFELQAELNKLIDYQNMLYQRLLVLAKLREQVKARYPQAVLPFDVIYRDYINLYNSRNAQIKAKSSSYDVAVQPDFSPLAQQFSTGAGVSIGAVLITIAVVAAVAILAGATAYTITEVKRQNLAAENEIKGLDKLLSTFKTLPGADAASLGNVLAKIDYTPGGTTPPATGLTSTINTLVYGGVFVAILYFGSKMLAK